MTHSAADERILLQHGPYNIEDILALQESFYKTALVHECASPAFIVTEHHPVYACPRHLTGDLKPLVRRFKNDGTPSLPAPLIAVDRTAGSITYHGPGQLTCYLIMDLSREGISITEVGERIDRVVIRSLEYFSIHADGKPESYPPAASGVWVLHSDRRGDMLKKIASRGVSVRSGVTRFGFALNVNTDLSYFDHIYPCGLENMHMTSMEAVARETFSLRDVTSVLLAELRKEF